MKVKIGGKVYDSMDQPILVVFEGNELELVKGMPEQSSKFCSYPSDENYSVEQIEEFMEID